MFEKTAGYRIFFWMSLVVIGIFVFFPLYWLVNTSFKNASEIFELTFIPSAPTIQNYVNVITDGTLLTYLKNSLFVAGVSAVLTTFVSAYAAYSFSKFRYRGRKSLMILFILSKVFPYAVLLLTIYLIMKNFGILDSYLSLILAFVTFTLPVGTWTLKAFFDQIPNSLIESAKIDGASQFKIIHKVIFPITVPGLVATALYGFVWAWNDLLYSLTLITSPEKRTLAPGLIMNYMGEFQSNWGNMMAASIVASIPVTIMFVLLQKYFVQGLTSGAVKG
ncbi:carbohydrate ABC transporter permease [Virgibacillus senegalensis]|uniref:carbohydrate ABC transporter permease n=1 Tax=Virgibacillus senegalensis TaxID=1499679 RepID=UPI00069F2731|nr:carbohydrate ABC transporter permease [Virgibacillus senegalensis]